MTDALLIDRTLAATGSTAVGEKDGLEGRWRR
jgi:hypothetical protein